jgi:predicted nucleic acid-binding protein
MLSFPQVDRWLHDLGSYRRVGLDSNLIIYALGDVFPYRELVQHVFVLLERGLMTGIASTIVQAEVCVGPLMRRKRLELERAELVFRNSPNLVVVDCDRAVARRAAEVRAASRMPLPDAIVVATALEARCDALIGNDSRMTGHTFGLPYLYLNNYLN